MQLVFFLLCQQLDKDLVNKGSREANALSARGRRGESFEIHSVVAVRGRII